MTGLYVHVPFCKSKCQYCDFVSYVDLESIPRYLEALKYEAQLLGHSGAKVETVYVGGGTPSVFAPEQLVELFATLKEAFVFVEGVEVTVELNPDDVNVEILEALREVGVNRLSLGIQSFDDSVLLFLGRRHTSSAAYRAIELIRDENWTELSLDVMYGWHFQTERSHRDTLQRALSFKPTHLSCYQLTVEGDAPFALRHARGERLEADEEMERRLFLLTHYLLTDAGYEHYEVSNYARPGHRSRHNGSYWRHAAYVGLGPAAHSFDGIRRRSWNVTSIPDYVSRALRGDEFIADSETLTESQLLLEQLFLGFRTAEGFDESLLSGITGTKEVLSGLVEEGLCLRQRGRVIATVEGMLVADGLPLRFNLM